MRRCTGSALCGFFIAIGAGQGPARAQEPALSPSLDPALTDRASTADTPPPQGQRPWTIDLAGRIFVRDTLSRVDVGADPAWAHARDIDQARLAIDYERKKLRIALEVDFGGGDADIKDVFVRILPADILRVQAGQFKVPMSFIGLKSKWKLPAIERGILSDLKEADRDLPFAGGRGQGAAVELRPQLVLSPRFTVALFHNPLAQTGAVPLDPTDEVTQDAYARIEFEPAPPLKLAAAFALIGYTEGPGALDGFRHLPMGSFELALEIDPLRAWVEGFVGQSFFVESGAQSGTFVAARALVAPRFRDVAGALWRIEPFAGGSILDPTGEVKGERVSEIVGGVNLAFTKRWRLQVEVAQRVAEGDAAAVADTTLIRVQLGAAFSETLQ